MDDITEVERLRRQRISETMKKSPKVRRGENHLCWKGDNASYSSLHEWLVKYKPKVECCEECGKKKPLELANISGKYTRSFNDYKWLCISCHRKKDFNYETYDGGFKVRPLSFWKNKKMPESIKSKMSESLKGRALSESHKENIRIANTGKHHSEETLQKLRDSHRGKPWSNKRRKLFNEKKVKNEFW